jgi:hypothetical protein
MHEGKDEARISVHLDVCVLCVCACVGCVHNSFVLAYGMRAWVWVSCVCVHVVTCTTLATYRFDA